MSITWISKHNKDWLDMGVWTTRQERLLRDFASSGVEVVREEILRETGVDHTVRAIEVYASQLGVSLRKRSTCVRCGATGIYICRNGICLRCIGFQLAAEDAKSC